MVTRSSPNVKPDLGLDTTTTTTKPHTDTDQVLSDVANFLLADNDFTAVDDAERDTDNLLSATEQVKKAAMYADDSLTEMYKAASQAPTASNASRKYGELIEVCGAIRDARKNIDDLIYILQCHSTELQSMERMSAEKIHAYVNIFDFPLPNELRPPSKSNSSTGAADGEGIPW